ncbi:MAG: hypothetical protein KBE23_03220 [Chloroflexi bacterium]|nr:hypothetical protein [Chloroflexota bacterium]MBP7041724.1 hypothetical protein [Chloroflexota bacterium]
MNARQRFLFILFVLILLVVGVTAVAPIPPKSPSSPGLAIVLKPQQTIMVTCVGGDELIVAPSGDLDAELTCRVWVKQP